MVASEKEVAASEKELKAADAEIKAADAKIVAAETKAQLADKELEAAEKLREKDSTSGPAEADELDGNSIGLSAGTAVRGDALVVAVAVIVVMLSTAADAMG